MNVLEKMLWIFQDDVEQTVRIKFDSVSQDYPKPDEDVLTVIRDSVDSCVKTTSMDPSILITLDSSYKPKGGGFGLTFKGTAYTNKAEQKVCVKVVSRCT